MEGETIWYYEGNGERRGPGSASELLERRRGGELSDDTLVWREGLADWVRFADSELAGGAGPGAAIPPPVPTWASLFVPREVRPRPRFDAPILACYDRAWSLLVSRFWPFVGCFALATLILGVASQFIIPAFFLAFPLTGGFAWYGLRILRGQEASVDTLFEGFRRQFGPLAIANLIVVGIATVWALILVAVIVAVAVVFGAVGNRMAGDGGEVGPGFVTVAALIGIVIWLVFAVPLFLLQAVGNFATLLILDGALGAGTALRLAWQAAKRHLAKIALFMLLSGFLASIGMVALYVGFFVTGAWAALASVCLYEEAFGEEGAGLSARE